MHRHAEEGARIIDLPRISERRRAGHPPPSRALRRHGFPDRLQGEDIPLGARIIHVADALDSMLTTRIYRAARPAAEALQEARRAAGTQFCPRCVTALERILPIESLESENDRERLSAVAS